VSVMTGTGIHTRGGTSACVQPEPPGFIAYAAYERTRRRQTGRRRGGSGENIAREVKSPSTVYLQPSYLLGKISAWHALNSYPLLK